MQCDISVITKSLVVVFWQTGMASKMMCTDGLIGLLIKKKKLCTTVSEIKWFCWKTLGFKSLFQQTALLFSFTERMKGTKEEGVHRTKTCELGKLRKLAWNHTQNHHKLEKTGASHASLLLMHMLESTGVTGGDWRKRSATSRLHNLSAPKAVLEHFVFLISFCL